MCLSNGITPQLIAFRELFKPSKDLASLQVSNENKNLVFGLVFFYEGRHR